MVHVLKEKSSGTIDTDLWVDQYGQQLYTLALRRVKYSAQAETLVQETLLSAADTKRRFGGLSDEGVWLTDMLEAKIRDHFRKVFQKKPFKDVRENEAASNSFFDQQGRHRNLLGIHELDPGKEAQTKKFWPAFFDCLQELPEAVAEAFYLREIEQMDVAEICEILNISVENLYVLLHRARLYMCHVLAPKVADDTQVQLFLS